MANQSMDRAVRRFSHSILIAVALGLLAATSALAQDWDSVSYVKHSDLQAVNSDGTPAYAGGFPLRIIGVVLNNTEDWLDPTPAYDPGVHLFELGGEAEFYVGAVDLDGTEWDPDPSTPFDDFGGTACWIGQNYGNHIMHQDPMFSYTDAEWTAELGRLNLFGGDGVTDPIAAGDLVEVRARGGLHYSGKYNVNEQHSNLPATDFEIVRLQSGFGLSAPPVIQLSDLKTESDEFIFDPTRSSGGELYQSRRVRIRNLHVDEAVDWSANTDITVSSGTRTLTIHLGLNPSFDGTELFAPGEKFSVCGILDQHSTSGMFGTDGYQLLVMNADAFTAAGPVAGDANGDGCVDIQDFVRLKQRYGMAYGATWADGDFNGDGSVNIMDFVILKQNYGAGSGAGDPPIGR